MWTRTQGTIHKTNTQSTLPRGYIYQSIHTYLLRRQNSTTLPTVGTIEDMPIHPAPETSTGRPWVKGKNTNPGRSPVNKVSHVYTRDWLGARLFRFVRHPAPLSIIIGTIPTTSHQSSAAECYLDITITATVQIKSLDLRPLHFSNTYLLWHIIAVASYPTL